MEQLNKNVNNHYSEEIDLRQVFAALKKRYKLMLIITAISVLTAGILTFFVVKPVYETKAVLMVTQAAPDGSSAARQLTGDGLEGLMNQLSRPPDMTINTYLGQLNSEAMMNRVIKKLKLDRQGYSPMGLARYIEVVNPRDSSLIEVHVRHTDPYMTAKIANTLTEEFLAFISETNEQQMGKSVVFLQKQAAEAGEELNRAVAALNDMELQSGNVILTESLFKTKSEELSRYQSQMVKADLEYRQILTGKQEAEKKLAVTAPMLKVVTGYDQSGTPVEVEQVNPSYTQLQAIINEKTVALAEKTAEAAGARSVVARLEGELKSLREELAKNKTTLELAQKEVARLEQTNALFKTKINETEIGKSMKLGETSLLLVSPATAPDYPVKPNKTVNMAAALVIGLMVSVALAFLLNYLDNTVKTAEEVEDFLGLPVLGQIPVYKPFKGESTLRQAESAGQPLGM